MNQKNDFFNYIETAGDSSRRTRWVLLVMITTCILIFAATLNSRKGNWIDKRIEVCRYVYNHFSCLKSKAEAEKYDYKKTLEDKDLEGRAVRFIYHYKIESANDAENLLKGYISSKQNYIQIIRVPFLSFTFDINDLGFISGISLVVILLFFRFCLSRELTNLKIVFKEAKGYENCENQCYTLMSMKQVLTIPPTDDIIQDNFWRFLLKFVYVIPFIVHSIVVSNDFDTKDIGNILSPDNMRALLWANIASIIIILLLTIHCLWISMKIDGVWVAAKKSEESKSKKRIDLNPNKSGNTENPITPSENIKNE